MSNEGSSNAPDIVDLTLDDEMSVVYDAPAEVVETAFLDIIQANNGDSEVEELEEIEEEELVEEVEEENQEEPVDSMPFEPMETQEIEEENRQPSEGSRESLQDDDGCIVEEEVMQSAESRKKKHCDRAVEFLSWFHRLKREQFKEWNFDTVNYLEEVVTEHLVMELELCKTIAKAYGECEDLEEIVEKFELDDPEIAVVAICIGVLEVKNAFKIPFTALCDDRVDEWTIDKAIKFLDQPHCGLRPGINGPLKLLQFSLTKPSHCILALTVIWLIESDLDCRLDFDLESVFETIPAVEMSNMIVQEAINHWRQQPECGNEEISRNLDEFFREIDTAMNVFGVQMEAVKKEAEIEQHPLIEEELIEELPNLDYMKPEDRSKVANSTILTQQMLADMTELSKQAAEQYEKKSDFLKMFKMQPGDYCLARASKQDAQELTMARVLEVKDQTTYRVRFMDTHKEHDVLIRDLAMLHPGIWHPVFGTDTVGLRVAAYVTLPYGPAGKTRSYWFSGTIAGRSQNHNGDFLVFLDTGVDDYVTAPLKPSDKDFHVASRELVSGEPWVLDEVKEKIEAAKIVMMVGQSANELGVFDRRKVSVWHRDPTKAVYIESFMKAHPEWPLLRMPVGMRFTVYTSLKDKTKNRVVAVWSDRALAWVRYAGNPHLAGSDCIDFPCENPTHRHHDEKIYRGSHRLEGVAQKKEMLTANNNLSRRRKGQFASQFEPTEMERSMPVRRTQISQNGPQNARTNVTVPKYEMSKEMIEMRKRKQNLYKKIVNKTPKLKPLSELKPHDVCGPDCLQNMDSNPYDPKFHQCSPIHTPLMSGWRRMKISISAGKKRSPWRKLVMYYAPCGRPMEEMSDISAYLRATLSQLTIDCFSFNSDVETETYVTVDDRFRKMADFADGKEGIPIPVVNSVDQEDPPKMEYMRRRFQYDPSVDISSIAKSFCSGCTCDGDCSDASKCECQKLSVEEMQLMPKMVQYNGREKIIPHYQNRSLSSKVITGVYECNDQCSCKRALCHNRVVQNNIKYPMQIFKTAQSGWGVRALTDIPEGSFICNYVGALLTNDLAEQLKNDDQYFADLDLKDAVETHKLREDNDTDLGFGDGNESDFTMSDDDESDGDEDDDKSDKPVVMRGVVERSERNVRTRQQGRKAKDGEGEGENGEELEEEEEEEEGEKDKSASEKPAGAMFNWDDYFMDSALFVVDAKQKGNLGRFLNHSCDPNVQVQHVMYDTHDLRLPWVSFFTTKLVKAGEELCWDYAYTVLNTDDERLACNCGAANCRRRLL